tara:strand:+ start:2364 stop:3773 length:1410 start_codon:yes stop_codon:yes gene_type:complete
MNKKKSDKTKLIIYELNEVPRRLIDTYVKDYPNSAIAEIIRDGTLLNTHTNDDGELHPWSTWPTVHRGVDNRKHNIRYINQDLSFSKKYKPIWEILNSNKIDVGIFGSLQSFPPKKNKNYKFYLPDTFAPSPEAYPKELSLFQDFNLTLAGENKAKSRRITIQNIKDFIYLLTKGIITKKSAFKAFSHIIKEKFNPKYKAQRSLIQNVLSFSIYMKYLYKYKPSFSTYFTNHVAGMMHRYWKNLYPNDFGLSKNDIDLFHSNSIIKAMHIADKNLKQLIKFAKINNYNLLVISSMGQDSIERGEYIPELVLRDFKKFINIIDLNLKDYQLLPAMQPDYCIKSKNPEAMKNLRKEIKKFINNEGEQIFVEKYKPVGLQINFSIKSSLSISNSRKCKFGDIPYSIEETGLEIIKRDIGTAYHIPEGIFAWYGDKSKILSNHLREKINTCRICPTILKLYGINIPSYMQKPL